MIQENDPPNEKSHMAFTSLEHSNLTSFMIKVTFTIISPYRGGNCCVLKQRPDSRTMPEKKEGDGHRFMTSQLRDLICLN